MFVCLLETGNLSLIVGQDVLISKQFQESSRLVNQTPQKVLGVEVFRNAPRCERLLHEVTQTQNEKEKKKNTTNLMSVCYFPPH